jgi:hypothetical protein
MLSIDTLILFSMLMILLKLCCSWSYFVGMQADILEKIICEVELSLQATGSFPESSVVEPPSTLMWTLFLLAQHFDRRRQYDKALEKIICEVELSLQATGSFPERCFIVITPSVLQIASFI